MMAYTEYKIGPLFYLSQITLFLFFMASAISTFIFVAQPQISFVLLLSLSVAFIMLATLAGGLKNFPMLLISTVAFCGPLYIGTVINPIFPVDIVAKLILLVCLIVMGWIVSGGPWREAFCGTFGYAMVVSGAINVVYLYQNGLLRAFEEGERFSGGETSHPNLIGLIMLSQSLGAAFVRQRWIRYPSLFVFGFVALTVQSRNAMALIGLIVLFRLGADFILTSRSRGVLGVVSPVLFVAAGVAALASTKVLSAAFLLSDPNRGLGTGFTGRNEAWQQTYEIFLQYPIFGCGVGQHVYVGNLIAYGHSMYLILLAEDGIVGTVAFVLFTLGAVVFFLRTALRSREADFTPILFATVILIYYGYGVFEGRAINVGNALSQIFFISVGAGLRTMFAAEPLPEPRATDDLAYGLRV
jgi:O-antigen ligase